MCMCLYMHTCVSVSGDQKKSPYTLKAESQLFELPDMSVKSQTQILHKKGKLFLTIWAISPVPTSLMS